MSHDSPVKSASPRPGAREAPVDLSYAAAPGCRACGKAIPQEAIYCPTCNAESNRGLTPRWLNVVFALVVFGAALAAFAPALDAEFVNFDDDKNLLDNFDFRGLSGKHLTWMFTTHKMGHYQPLSWLTLAVDYSLGGFTGLKYAHGGRFHVTNILLHALGAVAFYFLARRLLARAVRATTHERFLLGAAPVDATIQPGRIDLAICAAIAALLFAIHPLRCESVAWVTERRDVLSGLFLMLATLAYIKSVPDSRELRVRPVWFLATLGAAVITLAMFFLWFDVRKRPAGGSFQFRGMETHQVVLTAIFFIGTTVACALAMRSRPRSTWFMLAIGALVVSLFSKAWGMVMPAVLLVIDIWPLRRLGDNMDAPAAAQPRNQKGARRKAPAIDRPISLLDLLFEKVPFVVLSLIFGALAKWSQAAQADTMKSFEQHGIAQRLAQGFYGLMFYVWKTFVPTNLLPIYEIPEPFNVLTPRFVIAALLVMAVTVTLFICRKRYPALLAAWICYGIIVSPVLGVLQSGPQLVADRYSYLSCMPFALLVAGGLLVAVRRSAIWRSPGYSLGFLAAGVLGVLTWRQCGVWENSEAMWTYTHRGDPNSYNACQNLGIIKKEKRQYDEALELYRQGHALHPSPNFLTNIANVYSAIARESRNPNERRANHEQAAEYARQSIEMAKEKKLIQAELFINYGVVLQALNQPQEAYEQFRTAVRIKEKHPKAHNNCAAALIDLKRYGEAVDHATIAVELDPLYVNGWFTLGKACLRAGQPAEAARAFKQVTTLNPGWADAWMALGNSLEADGQPEEAIKAYKKVLQLKPNHAEAQAALRRLQGRP